MKNLTTIYFSVLLAVGIAACKKKENPASSSNTTHSENYLPSVPGSYFVYQWYSIDSNQVEAELPNVDTMYVLGDTMINQQNYVRFYGVCRTPGTEKQRLYYRDSSGYIVDHHGYVIYSYTNFTDNLETSIVNSWNQVNKMTGNQIPFNTQAGSFQTIEGTLTVSDNGNPITNCGDTVFTLKTNYAKNVGVVRCQSAYLIMVANCSKYERRLKSYYIP